MLPLDHGRAVRFARSIATWLLLVLIAVLALLALSNLVLSIIHSDYDDQNNRAPGLRIAAAAVCPCVAIYSLVTSGSLVRSDRDRRQGRGLRIAALTILTILLTLGTWVVDILSGPL